MRVLLLLGSLLLLAALAAALWLLAGDPSPSDAPALERASAAGEGETQVEPAGGARLALEFLPASEGASGAAPERVPETSTLTGGEPARRAGRVLDLRGAPVPGVRVHRGRAEASATTDASGAFSFGAETPSHELRIDPGEHVLLARGRLPGAELVLVVAEHTRLEGLVVDEEELPVEGAVIGLTFSLDAQAGFPLVLERESGPLLLGARTDAAGRFALLDVPSAPAALDAEASGYARASSVWRPGEGTLRLVLRRPRPVEGFLVEGVVVDPRGARVAGATVRLGPEETLSRKDGSFGLAIEEGGSLDPRSAGWRERAARHALAAFLEGFGPAVIPGFGERLDDPAARSGVVLRLAEASRSIEGRVLDAEGRPQAGFRIGILDPTSLGLGSATVEMPAMADREVYSDEQGRFALGGLLERSYRLFAVHRESGAVVESAPIPAGSRAVELRLAARPGRTLIGRLRSRAGEPLAEIAITAVYGVGADLVPAWTSEAARSDAEGRFALGRVPCAALLLDLSGAGIRPRRLEIEAGEEDLELAIELARKLRLTVELARPSEADSFALVDAEGAVLRVDVQGLSGGWSMYHFVPLREGRSFPCDVEDEAVELVLYRERTEVRRVPLALRAVELNVLRL